MIHHHFLDYNLYQLLGYSLQTRYSHVRHFRLLQKHDLATDQHDRRDRMTDQRLKKVPPPPEDGRIFSSSRVWAFSS